MSDFGWREATRIIILLLMTLVVLFPLGATLLAGFKTQGDLTTNPFWLPREWHFEFYGQIMQDSSFWSYLWNSLFISVVTTIITVIVASMASFVFAHIRFFGSDYIFGYLLMGLMFPFAAAIIPLFIKVRDFGLLDTPWGVIVPQVAFGLAFSVLLFRTFFDDMPKELFEAARVDGCGYSRFYLSFTLPLSMPIIATVATFIFTGSWNNYLLPLIMLNSREAYTWPLGMLQYQGEFIVEWNKILAFVSLSLAPAIVFFLAAQKYIVAGLTGGAVKG